MISGVEEKILKGGSLSKTAIYRLNNGKRIIRKSINRIDNREYGYVRWYSQMKRIQRYNAMFPGIFPKLLDVGGNDTLAYYDLEYFEEAQDLKYFLTKEYINEAEIIKAHDALWVSMNRMHDLTILESKKHSINLYFEEEVIQKLNDAKNNDEFTEYIHQDILIYNENKCSTLIKNLGWYKKEFQSQNIPEECYTHGNITLENVIYIPNEQRILFIDPYDENIIDCRENEYSQVLQCCSNSYGFINERNVEVNGNKAIFKKNIPIGLKIFNRMFKNELERKYSKKTIYLIKLFQISQFVRLLPFKIATGDIEKAKYFYTLASNLLHTQRIKNE